MDLAHRLLPLTAMMLIGSGQWVMAQSQPTPNRAGSLHPPQLPSAIDYRAAISLDKRKCGIGKAIKFSPPKNKVGQARDRLAVEEPRMRCGGTRTADGRYALALIPISAFSRTITPYPTFFFYMPFTSVHQATFTLASSETSYPFYETKVALKGQRGIIRLPLPSDAPHLAIGKRYFWQFRFEIATDEPPPLASNWLMVMKGEIQRVDPGTPILKQLQTAAERTRPAIYAEQGLWQDALAALAHLHKTYPTDPTITADWVSLLRQGDLDFLAEEPILDATIARRSIDSRR